MIAPTKTDDIAVTVVVEHVLSTLTSKRRGDYGSIFRGHTVGGRKFRFKFNDYSFDPSHQVVGRVPLGGEVWIIEGTPEYDPEYGEQIIVKTATLTRPSGRLLVDVLCSSLFPGVGMAAASTLWDRWGEILYEHLENGDEVALLDALGTTRRAHEQVQTLLTNWPFVGIEPKVMRWMDQHGFPRNLAQDCARCYGVNTIDLLEEDPYRLIAFADWRTVDPVALGMGVALNDSRRLAAACEAVCYTRMDRHQDTVVDLPTLREGLRNALGAPFSASKAISAAEAADVLERVPDGWQALGAYGMERYIADRCRRLVTGDDGKESQPELLQRESSAASARPWLERLAASARTSTKP